MGLVWPCSRSSRKRRTKITRELYGSIIRKILLMWKTLPVLVLSQKSTTICWPVIRAVQCICWTSPKKLSFPRKNCLWGGELFTYRRHLWVMAMWRSQLWRWCSTLTERYTFWDISTHSLNWSSRIRWKWRWMTAIPINCRIAVSLLITADCS